jgi:hypothetical protein
MLILTDAERKLLKRLADEGKTTRLTLGELDVAKALEADGLVFMVRDTLNAIITAKGRHRLAGEATKPPKPPKPPFGFLE